jgi:hypothetical protein
MSGFIKKNKFATRGHNVLWFFECPDCGAVVIDNVNDINRRIPCGIKLRQKTMSGRLRYCLSELKSNKISILKLARLLGYDPTTVNNFINGDFMKIDHDVILSASTVINTEFLYARSCVRYRNKIDLIKEFLNK